MALWLSVQIQGLVCFRAGSLLAALAIEPRHGTSDHAQMLGAGATTSDHEGLLGFSLAAIQG